MINYYFLNERTNFFKNRGCCRAIIHCNWVMISITGKEIQRTGFFSKFDKEVKTFAFFIITFSLKTDYSARNTKLKLRIWPVVLNFPK
jgi:hypothetical protein